MIFCFVCKTSRRRAMDYEEILHGNITQEFILWRDFCFVCKTSRRRAMDYEEIVSQEKTAMAVFFVGVFCLETGLGSPDFFGRGLFFGAKNVERWQVATFLVEIKSVTQDKLSRNRFTYIFRRSVWKL